MNKFAIKGTKEKKKEGKEDYRFDQQIRTELEVNKK